MEIDLRFERTGDKVENSLVKVPNFIRSDTIDIQGKVYGKLLTGLTATLTARMLMPDGSTGPILFEKTSSGVGAAITLTAVNTSVSTVAISIPTADTSALDVGQKVVFDIEFTTTTTPPVVRTVKGAFVIEEDYTLN